jgi:Tetratricopeptide repeat
VGVDRLRVCELYAAGPDVEGSGSGYRLGDRLVLTAQHVIAPALADTGGQVLVRPVGVAEWLPGRVEWQNADADAALIRIEDQGWRASAGETVLRWGGLAGSDPVACAALGFPWASVRPDRMRDTAHVYGQLAPLGQLRQGRLDLDIASASPTAREGGSPWAGISGAGVIADSHLVGVITVDSARYQDRLVALPVSALLEDVGFRDRLEAHGLTAKMAPVGAGWYLRLAGEQSVCLGPAYRPVSRRLRPAPSTLLRPEHGLVPFLARETVLDQITGWCHGPPGTPVLLVTGGGGSGKTRLAREACVRMLMAGWDAGLADDQRRNGAATHRLERPTLLVVDDADLSTGLISAVVDYLRWDDAGPPVRLLLLARSAGTWWERLVRQQELYDSYTAVDLDEHPVEPADRAEHFRRASTAFAAHAGAAAQAVDPAPAELDDPAYAEPLLIHVAALLRTMDIPATPPPGPRGEVAPARDSTTEEEGRLVTQQLLRALCERERTRWYQLGRQLPFNPDLALADQVVALATLTAAVDQRSATSLLAALPNQAEVTRIGAEALVVWAHQLYAGPRYWNPMRPDLLAEQHLADTPQLAALTIATAQLGAGHPWEAGLLTQLLAELTRGAPNQPAIQAALNSLLAANLPQIIDLVVMTDHAELADLVNLALHLAPQPHLAPELVGRMPERSVRLAALAITLTSQQVTHHRAALVGADPDVVGRLAMALNDLSVRLAGLGRREEALAAVEEAVSIRRELAAAHPDAFHADLAMSLNNLSACLAGLGRQEALAAVEEATGLYRELAAAHPDAFHADLAASLNNLAIQLAGLGRREEALAAVEEAVSIRRELAAAHPDAFHADLAASLNNLAIQLAGLGRRQEALAAVEEAVSIRQELAAAHPDAFHADLANSLNNLAIQLAGLGRREEALAAVEEAVSIRRELAAAHPDAFQADLAASLNNLAIWLSDLGRREEALAAAEEAVSIRRELAAAHPDAFHADLAASLNNLAIQLARLGRREEALAAAEEAVSLYRELAAAHPDAFHADLANSLNNLAIQLARLRRREEAVAAAEEATGLYRELAAAHPDAFHADLANSLNNLALWLSDLGRREEALAASQEAVSIRPELAVGWPDAYRDDLEEPSRVVALLDHGEDLGGAPWPPQTDGARAAAARAGIRGHKRGRADWHRSWWCWLVGRRRN